MKTKRKKSKKFVFHLFVAGMTPKSTMAITKVKTIIEKSFAGDYELKVVDLYKNPQAAKQEEIIAAPTLIKKLPLPIRRFIGDMSDARRILVGLDIKAD